MRINKGTYLFIVFLLACTTGMAQMSMSPMAMATGTVTMSGGNPIVMDGKGKCLNVASGLATMEIIHNGKGVFAASCVETAPVATVLSLTSVQVQVYPNPTHGISTLKCQGQFDANLSCQVRIMSIDGRTMMSKMVLMKDVQAGYTIDASSYAAGTYVVNLSFMSQNYNVKLIKL